MQKITPSLWFKDAKSLEDAVNLYTSLFNNSKVLSSSRYPEGAPGPAKAGDLLTIDFELDGVRMNGLNGGPQFPFTEAISFVIDCEDQAEVDKYWNALTANGGEESQCGWLKDPWGVSWQIVPKALGELMSGPDAAKSERVMKAMLQMKKLVIADLEAAANAV